MKGEGEVSPQVSFHCSLSTMANEVLPLLVKCPSPLCPTSPCLLAPSCVCFGNNRVGGVLKVCCLRLLKGRPEGFVPAGGPWTPHQDLTKPSLSSPPLPLTRVAHGRQCFWKPLEASGRLSYLRS